MQGISHTIVYRLVNLADILKGDFLSKASGLFFWEISSYVLVNIIFKQIK